jgi:hypothetical protein
VVIVDNANQRFIVVLASVNHVVQELGCERGATSGTQINADTVLSGST